MAAKLATQVDLNDWVQMTNDQVSKTNPPFFRFMNATSTFILLPLGIIAVYGLIKQKEWKIPGIIFAALHANNVLLYLYEVFQQYSAPTNPALILGANGVWFLLSALMLWRYSQTPLFPAGTATKSSVKTVNGTPPVHASVGLTPVNGVPAIIAPTTDSHALDDITSKSPRLKTPSRAKAPKSSKKSKDKSKSEDTEDSGVTSPTKEKKSPIKIGGDAIAALAKIMKDSPVKKKKK